MSTNTTKKTKTRRRNNKRSYNKIEKQIETHQTPYFEMLDAYFEKDDLDLIDAYVDQPQLSRFMAVEVSTEDDDGSSLSDETATQVFIVCLSMVALLNQSNSEE